MAFPHIWYLWTILVTFVLTWTVFHVSNKRKKIRKMSDATTTTEERRNGGRDDVIIVGGGVGGSALAYALAKDGRRVHVIERDMREPERMMGEVMQPGGRFMLAKLGLQDCLEGIDAQNTTGLAVYKDEREAVLPFPVENNFPYEPSARSFYNGRFVQRLRQKASSLPKYVYIIASIICFFYKIYSYTWKFGGVRMEEGSARSLIEEQGVVKGVTYKNSACEETRAYAPLVVVCDGCYSNLRRSLVDSKEETHTYMVGYVTKNSRLHDPNSLHLILSRPIVCIMYQVTSDEVRCMVEIPVDNVPSIASGEMSNFLKKTMAPQIPPKLREIFMKGINEGAQIKVTATKSMSATLSEKKGDAFNMRHPLIASGMMVVLSDILILRHLLQPLDDFANVNEVSQVIKSFNGIRKPMSATANTLGSAFSQVVVASEDEAKEAMREARMSVLGGMNPCPPSLMLHLSAITLFAIAHMLAPFPSPLRVWHSLRLFKGNSTLHLLLKMLQTAVSAGRIRDLVSGNDTTLPLVLEIPGNVPTYDERIICSSVFV